MQENFYYIVDKYFNLGILGIVFAIMFVLLTVALLVYNSVWSSEKRLLLSYKRAALQFAKNNYIDSYNAELYSQKVIKILPQTVRKAWLQLMINNSSDNQLRLRRSIDDAYDKGAFVGIVVVLSVYVSAILIMVVAGAINADFNTIRGFSMGIALVVGALCVLALTLQMSYINLKYSEVPINLTAVLKDRVVRTNALCGVRNNANSVSSAKDSKITSDNFGRVILSANNLGMNNNKQSAMHIENFSKSANEVPDKQFDYADIVHNRNISGVNVSKSVKSVTKADELVMTIKQFITDNPNAESLSLIKDCLDETLGYQYCESAERKKLLQAKLLLDN